MKRKCVAVSGVLALLCAVGPEMSRADTHQTSQLPLLIKSGSGLKSGKPSFLRVLPEGTGTAIRVRLGKGDGSLDQTYELNALPFSENTRGHEVSWVPLDRGFLETSGAFPGDSCIKDEGNDYFQRAPLSRIRDVIGNKISNRSSLTEKARGELEQSTPWMNGWKDDCLKGGTSPAPQRTTVNSSRVLSFNQMSANILDLVNSDAAGRVGTKEVLVRGAKEKSVDAFAADELFQNLGVRFQPDTEKVVSAKRMSLLEGLRIYFGTYPTFFCRDSKDHSSEDPGCEVFKNSERFGAFFGDTSGAYKKESLDTLLSLRTKEKSSAQSPTPNMESPFSRYGYLDRPLAYDLFNKNIKQAEQVYGFRSVDASEIPGAEALSKALRESMVPGPKEYLFGADWLAKGAALGSRLAELEESVPGLESSAEEFYDNLLADITTADGFLVSSRLTEEQMTWTGERVALQTYMRRYGLKSVDELFAESSSLEVLRVINPLQ